MLIEFNSLTPIYIQIADAIEDDILSEKLKSGDNCYSQLVIAKELSVNPATAAKGIRLLVERGILDKQRGLAMTVTHGALEKIKQRKIKETFSVMLTDIVNEAKKLGITKDAVLNMISDYYEEEEI